MCNIIRNSSSYFSRIYHRGYYELCYLLYMRATKEKKERFVNVAMILYVTLTIVSNLHSGIKKQYF